MDFKLSEVKILFQFCFCLSVSYFLIVLSLIFVCGEDRVYIQFLVQPQKSYFVWQVARVQLVHTQIGRQTGLCWRVKSQWQLANTPVTSTYFNFASLNQCLYGATVRLTAVGLFSSYFCYTCLFFNQHAWLYQFISNYLVGAFCSSVFGVCCSITMTENNTQSLILELCY